MAWPAEYDKDMARQRDLERAGWKFVRIRGGDFFRDSWKVAKTKISGMSGDSLGLEPHERLNFLLIAHAWDAAHPRD